MPRSQKMSPRQAFLDTIAGQFLGTLVDRPSLVLLTHLLEDRPDFIRAVSKYANISSIIAIPYSTNSEIAAGLSLEYAVVRPTLEELLSGAPVRAALMAASDLDEPFALFEIGGYGSAIGPNDPLTQDKHFRGVVEGTEAGLVRYRQGPARTYPVVAIPMSPIKAAESALVGPACAASIERILRAAGVSIEPRTAVILGFGRVGASAARSLRERGFVVYVYDVDELKRLQALAEGFATPTRSAALGMSDLVVSATGRLSWSEEDALSTKPGAVFASCSSKDVEFNFARLLTKHPYKRITSEISRVDICDRRFYFLFEGHPVNFSDGANLGPLLTLLQGEIIASLAQVFRQRVPAGIHPPEAANRSSILSLWREYFIDERSGWYSSSALEYSEFTT